MIKKIFLVFLTVFIFVFVFIPRNVLANDCSCKIENGGKVLTTNDCNTSIVKNGSEKSIEKPVMYVDSNNSNNCTCTCETVTVNTSLFNLSYDDPSRGTEIYCSDLKSINTAVGCIPYETNGFVVWLLPKLFGLFGGIAFLLMVYGFILLATSSGDEKKLQGAKETITSAVVGLTVSLLALFVLRLIAIDILHIPGF